MSRFNSRLVEKVKEDEAEEKRQEQLKEAVGVKDNDIVIKEKGLKDYVKSIVKSLGYLIFVIFVFIGLVTIINPASQTVIRSLLGM